MSRLFDIYRIVHEQGFLPIFVHDGLDARMQVEACVAAGVKAIEYTLRRPDAREMIPWIRKVYPDLHLLVGSTLDDEKIVRKMRRKYPQLMTIEELADMGVDGFVSMLGWKLESIYKYAPTHIVIPSAGTVTEAFLQISAGAHLAKISGDRLDLVKQCRLAPTFDYCPIFVTGGMTPERIPEAINAGAVMIASGFDIMLKGLTGDASVERMTEFLKVYLSTVRATREEVWPEMAAAIGASSQVWLDSLPHYHPF